MDDEHIDGAEVDQQSSSSSPSSPSHSQSFPSFPSSQKERSAPSSSASSSSSSAPFSPTSSSRQAIADHTSLRHPVASSSQATSAHPLSNGGVSSTAAHRSNGVDAMWRFSAGGDSLSEPSATEDGFIYAGRYIAGEGGGDIPSEAGPSEFVRIRPRDQIIPGDSVVRLDADVNTNELGNAPVMLEGDSGKSLTHIQRENSPQGLGKEVLLDREQSNGPIEEMNYTDRGIIIPVMLNRSGEGLNGDFVAHVAVMGGLGSTDSMPSTSSHVDVCGSTRKNNSADNGSGRYPIHGSKSEPDSAFKSPAGSIGSQTSGETCHLRPSTSAPALVSMDLTSKISLGEECMSSSPIPLREVDRIPPRFSQASPGLQRALTLPSGSFEGSDGTMNSNKKLTLMRSSTDKGKEEEAQDKENIRTPGLKMSKRKQKKLMKRIATVKRDGTVEFDVDRSARFASGLFGPEVEDGIDDSAFEGDEDAEEKTIPPLQIVMLIVGTRGDVQPFVAIGKHLQEHGHRVRLATHSNFEDFVLKSGLEFYPLGGDPKVLAGYMVKNKGFLPSGPSEIRTQRKQLKSIIHSLLPACISSHENDVPFTAQAIIANPPCYGHAHVAEALKVPLHIFFTMPWTPTSEFAHPLSRVHHFAANRLSYQVVDSLIWWGIRDLINDFRKKKLKLRPITYLSGTQFSISKLPTGYIWSPHLVPKPKDWGSKIDVVGFCFLNLSQDYKPPEPLVSWLRDGNAPIYVGFGSLPVEDPQGMTEIIVEALKQTSHRGIIDKGWGGIGNLKDLPNWIYLLENCPHDWLFPQCAAVVHHGGAGTTAAGLKAACPTTIVPFFGDQPFWGDQVHAKGVGPAPIPVEQFSLDKLVHAIQYMMDPEVKKRAVDLAEAMKGEDGVAGAVKAFHKHLPKEMPKTVPSLNSRSLYKRIMDVKMWPCSGSGLN